MNCCRPISFFIPALNCGGAQKVVVNLANALVDLTDNQIHVVLARCEGEFLAGLRSEIIVFDLKTKRASKSIFALARYLKSVRPHVIVSSMSYVNVVCIIASFLAGKPCKVVVREDSVVRRPSGGFADKSMCFLIQFLMRLLYPYANSVVTISDSVLKSILDSKIKVKNKVYVIGNPVCVDSSIESKRIIDDTAELSLPDFFICAIGRLTDAKGFDILLDAFSKVKNRKLHLVIVGQGELRDFLFHRSCELGLESRVHLVGYVNNPVSILQKAQVFVLSSRWEGFGIALVEALAVGIPIVSVDCFGAPREILENGIHGLLVPSEDPIALAKGIDMSLYNPVGTREGRIKRSLDFSPDKIARLYLDQVLLPIKDPSKDCSH